jgi:hypothetical protein
MLDAVTFAATEGEEPRDGWAAMPVSGSTVAAFLELFSTAARAGIVAADFGGATEGLSGALSYGTGDSGLLISQRTNRLRVDGGVFHLTPCSIELNMVRCGTVSPPSQWPWLGYHEITGQQQRYRLLDLDRLC